MPVILVTRGVEIGRFPSRLAWKEGKKTYLKNKIMKAKKGLGAWLKW
jgi:hypothetical protein